MKIHILGVCGTFMAGVARLAVELGHEVSGSDASAYPPMSTQLRSLGIAVGEGYDAGFLESAPDLVVVGNVLSRGNPAVEALLDSPLRYVSGPQWLREAVLEGRWVIAVAGTHGKTTTASLVAWLLESAGLRPGFLIGGVPLNFEVSARLGAAPFFVVEADEYDTAFFDKRSKFVHYRPRTLVLNNLEYDHADIFPDLAAIETQFAYLLRTVPSGGLVVVNAADASLARVLERGCWSPRETFRAAGGDAGAADWRGQARPPRGYTLRGPGGDEHAGEWSLPGAHNAANATAAIAAARHAGVPTAQGVAALDSFRGVARRLQVLREGPGVVVYDDFAHHPSAIRATLAALRERCGDGRVLVAFEPRSNTMRAGVHADDLAAAFDAADRVFFWRRPDLKFDAVRALQGLGERALVSDSVDFIAKCLLRELHNGDHVVLMSNGSFGGLNDKLVAGIDRR